MSRPPWQDTPGSSRGAYRGRAPGPPSSRTSTSSRSSSNTAPSSASYRSQAPRRPQGSYGRNRVDTDGWGRSSVPTSDGWGEGNRKDYTKLNQALKSRMVSKPRELEKAWGRGGPQGTKGVGQYDKLFRLLTNDILELVYEQKLDKETKDSILQSCAAILALDGIPHWEEGHVEDIRNLREHLEPEGYWDDYPEIPGDDDDECHEGYRSCARSYDLGVKRRTERSAIKGIMMR